MSEAAAPARTHRPILAVAAVLIGSMLTGFDQRVFSFGLADVRGAFGLGFDEGAWLSTLATAPQLLVAPAVGWFVVAFGLRRVMIVPSILYALLSLAIPFVRDGTALLILHGLHCLLLGVFLPATIIVIVQNLPQRWWLPALAVYVLRLGFSLNAGVSLVGWYVDGPGWQWIYWQDAVVAAVMALLFWLGSPKVPVQRQMVDRADWGGMLLLGAGIALLYAGLDQGNRLDWLESGLVASLLAGGFLLLVAFLVNEALVPDPWAHIRVLLSWNVALGVLTVLAFTVTSLSNTYLLPNFLRTVTQLRPEQIGPLLWFWVALPLVGVMFLAVWLARRIDPRWLILTGMAGFAVAAWIGVHVTHDWVAADFIPMALLQAVAHGFTFLGIIVFMLSNVGPAQTMALGAYIQVIRLNGSEFGTSTMATWLRQREQLHSNLIGLHVTGSDSDVTRVLSRLVGQFAAHGSAESAAARSGAVLASRVQREANVLSYVDGFQLAFAVAILGLVLISLMRKPPPGPLMPKV